MESQRVVNPQPEPEPSGSSDPLKHCPKCDQNKPLSEFSYHGSTADRLDSRCKNCVKLAKEQSNHEHPRELDLDPPDLDKETWQGGKYAGSIYKRSNSDSYTVRVGTKYKVFNPARYESDQEAYDVANRWRKEMSDTLGLTKNKYRIIKVNGVPTYIIVQLSHGYVTLLDFDMLDFIKNYTLSAGKSGSATGKFYCLYFDRDDDKMKSIHRYILNADMVDHISRYTLHNTRSNLRPSSSSGNNQNRTCVNDVSYNKIGDRIEAIITYTKIHRFEKAAIAQTFDSIEGARHWVERVCLELDVDNLTQETLMLKAHYEEIMTQYANEFKWRDLDADENASKAEALQAQGKKVSREVITNTKKDQIYRKYLEINPNYQGIQELLTYGDKIYHIVDNDHEYKYCPRKGCERWKEISEFYPSNRSWDKSEKWCKSCKQQPKE